LEEQVAEIGAEFVCGPLLLVTERLKLALATEAKTWKVVYGQQLNEKCSREMDEMLAFFDNLQKRLNRPIKDLDDVRSAMAALAEVRDNELRIDMTITPIEEAYVTLHKYSLHFNDENSVRVDTLAYGWQLLRAKVGLLIFCKEFS
jgi:dynein heavy chain